MPLILKVYKHACQISEFPHHDEILACEGRLVAVHGPAGLHQAMFEHPAELLS
jgi:hypothetical protein